MFENTVEEILKKDKHTKEIFLGAFARDELPKKPKHPSCFIVNTHPRSKPGEHWLALFYDDSGFATFFDSYGKQPAYYNLQSYLEETSKGWGWNKRRLQGSSNFCGFYAILFLLYRSRNKINQFFKEFYLNISKNDAKILKTIKEFS